MKVLPQQLRLYAVTDRTWLNGHRLADVVAQAIDGGATFVQLREKCLDEHDLLAEAEELSALCHFRHVPFVIDDNVEVALAAGADGVHVGQSDMAAKRARALLGPDKILGVSAHNAAEALAAQADGADYLGCGAAFVTGTKLDAHPVTAETMRAVTAAVNIPVVAIGGIDAANLAKGYDLETAVRRAKAYISGALAAMLDLGHGSGPMNHAFALDNEWSKEAEA